MATIGRFTGCDLSSAAIMCMPWAESGGLLRPQFSQRAAMLSLELASSAYDLKMDQWREAGWHDISYQVDNTLLTGAQVNRPSGRGLASIISDYYQYLAKSRVNRVNPFSQIRGALRQKESSDTCKAVVMIHSLPSGRYVVAIGFMGTGKRIYDWFSNFRLNAEEGMHAGFLQLTREFEKNCGAISFPETARELGLEKLTLNDILDECRQPRSRFMIWMAGHSQGGAIMQLFTIREIKRGLLRQNMIGYGFASPSALYDNPGCDAGSYPLYHIINADDSFPRMGASIHAGRCRVLQPDEKMRAQCYKNAWDSALFREMLSMIHTVYDSATAFLFTLSMLLALQDLPDDEAMNAINTLVGNLMPDMLLGALGTRVDDALQVPIRKIRQSYTRLTGGEEPPDSFLQPLRKRMAALIAQHGAKAFIKAFLAALGLPHKLHGEEIKPDAWLSSYQYIVIRRFSDLKQKIWCEPTIRMVCAPQRTQKGYQGGRFALFSREKTRRATRSPSRRTT